MVSNKNRKTKYKSIGFTEKAHDAFQSCVGKKTRSKTLLEMVELYNKSKSLDQKAQA